MQRRRHMCAKNSRRRIRGAYIFHVEKESDGRAERGQVGGAMPPCRVRIRRDANSAGDYMRGEEKTELIYVKCGECRR